MSRPQLYKILFLVGFWMACATFIVFYEGAVLQNTAIETQTPYRLSSVLMAVLPVTLIGSLLVASCDVLILGRLLRRRPYGTVLLVKTAFYLGCITVFTSLAVLLVDSRQLARPILSSEVLESYAQYVSSPQVLMTYLWWGICVLSGLFILQINEKFGQGVLFDMLRGRYHSPKEEDRIFMVLDLKSSTSHAEDLGHIKYSRLIQDCFFDLTDVVVEFGASIYQYVGDEVVLTWRLSKNKTLEKCIGVFFAYCGALEARKDHYEANFGFVPEFKAGLHAGRVTVAEVGEIKKELAYHGDPLNTVSRIQGKCNELGQRLLLSEQFARLADHPVGYSFVRLDEIKLRGKRQPITVYGVADARAH